MNGLAITIIVGQLPKLLGFSVDADGLIAEARGFVSGVADGDVNATAAVARHRRRSSGSCVLTRFLPKVPAVLVAVVIAALAGQRLQPRGPRRRHDRRAAARVPARSPIPTVPWHDIPPLVVGAVAIAVVALADTMSTASAFAARRGEQVRGNQEMVGIGAANIAAGLFQGFPVSTSGSRTAVAYQAGARSQVTGVVGAAVITLVLRVRDRR